MTSERRRIASAATLILVAYVLSRVLGAVRELVIANTFGTSHEIDNYRVAFGVPDLLFNLLLAGASSSAFIPVLSEHLAKGENQRAREIAQRVLNAAVLILTLGAVVLFIVAPFYVSLIAFGYSSHDHEVIVGLTRILLLQPIFLGAGGMVIGILTAYQRFLAQALAPLFYNGAIIVAAAAFAPRYRVTALAVGVVAGAMLHFGVQLPALWRTGWRPTRALGLNDPGVRKVGRLMFPIALGLAAAPVNVFVATLLGAAPSNPSAIAPRSPCASTSLCWFQRPWASHCSASRSPPHSSSGVSSGLGLCGTPHSPLPSSALGWRDRRRPPSWSGSSTPCRT